MSLQGIPILAIFEGVLSSVKLHFTATKKNVTALSCPDRKLVFKHVRNW